MPHPNPPNLREVHVWSRKTAGIVFANGSLLHRLHNQWTVLPTRENCN